MSLPTHSTPQKSKSSVSHTPSTPPDSHTQGELKQLINKEIYDQTFQFDPDVVARMLSPKSPQKTAKKSSEKSLLSDFKCLIDLPVVQLAIQRLPKPKLSELSTEERDTYIPIATFLNTCIKNCNDVYDDILKESSAKIPPFKICKPGERWFPTLHFMRYDKKTGDGIQGASHIKPDIIAVDSTGVDPNDLIADKVLAWWGLPQPKPSTDTKRHLRILIPVEVKGDWPELIRQSATYARSQFNVSPLRTFAVVIAVNHKSHELRYLIFHHGGLSASKVLRIDNDDDSVSIQKVLLSLLLSQSAEDAGLPPFADGQSFHLPTPFNGVSKIANHLYHSLSVRGRNTYVIRVETPPTSRDKAPSQTEVSKGEAPQNDASLYNSTGHYLRRTVQRVNYYESSSGSKLRESGNNTRGANTSKPPKAIVELEPTQLILPGEKTPRSLTAAHLESSHISFEKASDPFPFNVIVKCSWPSVEKENVESDMYKACDGEFGAPEAIISFRACFRENYPMSNSIFLPSENIEQFHWNIFEDQVPQTVEHRTLRITVVANEGQNLDECLDASDLAQCLLHSMLGWLTAYSRGWLHRDISIGNLLKLKEPIKPRKPFNVWGVASLFLPLEQQKLEREAFHFDKAVAMRLAANDPKQLKLLDTVDELDNIVKQFGLLTECKAIITDGDLAAYIPNYFRNTHDKGSISGTAEFMSTRLLKAMHRNISILQSPLDDLWSFYWTVLWATLFNRHRPRNSTNSTEEDWRADLREGGTRRDVVAQEIGTELPRIQRNKTHSRILRDMAPFLRGWHKSLNDLTTQMNEELTAVEDIADVEKDNAKIESEYLMLFHKTAYTGVLEFCRMLLATNLLKQTQS